MARTLAGFAILLIAIAVRPASLRAEEPVKPSDTNAAQSTLNLSGSNTYSGTTTLSGGTITITGASPAAAPMPKKPVSAGRVPGEVFYIITEGAGQGDNVRSVPCTGKETVLDAVSQVNGISQLSSTKMWIARPSSDSADKSTLLPVDWEAVSRRGINTTNYKLLPGDRLVLGEDPVIARSNFIAKRTIAFERIMGLISLTTSTLNGLSSPAANNEVFKELVQKGTFTDDDEVKKMVLEAIRLGDQENKKAGAKKNP